MEYEQDELVEVVESRIGYRGLAEVVSMLFENKYLVKAEINDRMRYFSVHERHLRKYIMGKNQGKKHGKQR